MSNTLPIVIAAGTLDGTAGTPVIALKGAYRCSTPVSSAKGVYTVTLADGFRPPALTTANFVFKVGTNTAAACVSATYVANTGVITFTCTSNSGQAAGVYAAIEAIVWFEISQTNI